MFGVAASKQFTFRGDGAEDNGVALVPRKMRKQRLLFKYFMAVIRK